MQHLTNHHIDTPPSALMHVMWRALTACVSALEDCLGKKLMIKNLQLYQGVLLPQGW